MKDYEELTLKALEHIRVADLNYQEWITVGMALHEDGFSCSVWDEWSKNDSRYHKGDCAKHWRTFTNGGGITGATIVQMAKDRGMTTGVVNGNKCIEWDDFIEYDGYSEADVYQPSVFDPVNELKTYISTLFDTEDIVSFVVDAYQDTDGKFKPGSAGATKTASEILAGLDRHSDDIAWTVGDWNHEAGAWIRFNPVDGDGVKNENITKFKYALVESDSMSITDQEATYRKLELPIAVMVHSGGRSCHAIVRVDAADYSEYRSRVTFLYDFLAKNGIDVDTQNRNPARLSRMPGATRGDKKQYIMATNIGRKSWVDWMDFAEGNEDELPDFVHITDFVNNPPVLPPELIEGVLRCGHKMLISGSSKAGKSFLLMQLCVAISEGRKWFDFQCMKGKVLYVDMELDPNSCIQRFLDVYNALGIKPTNENLTIWNLRGKQMPMNELVPKLIRRVKDQGYICVVLDPIYKLLNGDENKASDMAKFCGEFDKICAETGCATIYSHHHSKGAQGGKAAIDRSSGSGVFARDPDAILDMIELPLPAHMKNNVAETGATAWRMESSLREFRNFTPFSFWFEHPLHRIDNENLGTLHAKGDKDGNLDASSKRTTKEQRRSDLESAFLYCSENGFAKVSDMAEFIGIDKKTIRRYVDEFGGYRIENGLVIQGESEDSDDD